MALVKATRSNTNLKKAEFIVNIAADTMATTGGVTQSFKTAAGIYDVINMPPGAIVVGGDITVETVSNDTGTATMAVGDASSATRYLGATSIKTAARTVLVPTGYRSTGENIRITLANANGDATTGKVTVRVTYYQSGRADEAVPA